MSETTNDLVKEAVRLGGTLDDISGQVIVKKPTQDNAQRFYIMVINFYGQEDLMRVGRFIERNKLQGFSEEMVQSTEPLSMTKFTQPPLAPKCPIHHITMKPSKKHNAFFCPKKDGQDYCTVVIEL